jgi:putative membrane protein
MFYFDVALKLLLGFLALILVINLTGKGNLAPASASDQVQNYVLGGIVGGVIYNPDITIPEFMLILVIWLMLVLSLRWLKKHNNLVKRWVDGEPVVLISKGQIDVQAMKQVGLSAHDLSFKLRMQGIYSIKDVKQAILEQDGQIIITSFSETNPKYPLITDGVIQQTTLEMIDKDEDWLLAELKSQGIEDVSKIFLAEYNDGKIAITKQED